MNIDQIIGKLMGDGSIGEEKSALDAWKKEAEDNIKAIEDIRKIASLTDTLNGYQDFNSDEAWVSFSAQLEEESTKETRDHSKSKTTFFTLRNIGKIAAILVVVFGSVIFFNQYLNSATGEETINHYSAVEKMMNVDLSDGTQVTLDEAGDLKIVSNRSVELKGRAHFNVERDETQQFTIDMPIGNIVVLGTEFTVDADDSKTEVFVEEGSVRFELGQRTWTLVAGDLVKVVNNDVTVLKGDDNYDSWKNQRLIFRDNNMVEVVDALARHFKKDIIIENDNKKAFEKCNVMDVFTNSTLDQILNGLSKTHGLKYELRESKVFIVSAKC